MILTFKPFLRPEVKFELTAELNEAFEKSNLEIVHAIENGLEIYYLLKDACLCPDWYKKRIGYFLLLENTTNVTVSCLDAVNVVGELHWPGLIFVNQRKHDMHQLKEKP